MAKSKVVIQDLGNGQWYGELPNNYQVTISDGGKSDINFYRYGNRQIYEVDKLTPTTNENGVTTFSRDRKILFTKSEAIKEAKNFLTDNLDKPNTYVFANSNTSTRGIGSTSTSGTGK